MPSTSGSITTTAEFGSGGGAAVKTAWAALATASSKPRTGGGGGGMGGVAGGVGVVGCTAVETTGTDGAGAVGCCGAGVVGAVCVDAAGAGLFASGFVAVAGCCAAQPVSHAQSAIKTNEPHNAPVTSVLEPDIFF